MLETRSAAARQRDRLVGVLVPWLAIAAVLVLDAWARRFAILSDGISYIEIAEAYARGNWTGALNSYWSPMYSWLIALVYVVLRPSPEWKLPAFHLVNLLALVAALPCYEYFLRRLEGVFPAACRKSFRLLAYAMFAWCVVFVVPAGEFRPDPVLLAPVLVAFGLLLKPKCAFGARHAAALGALLAAAYFAKAATLFPALFIAGVVAFTRGWRKGLIAAATLAVLIAPYVVALSAKKGRPTFSDAGPLNYAWEVNGITRSTHWQGGIHPTRRLLSNPSVFEFAEPVPGSYPPWRDPSYWHEGLKTTFDPAAQWKAVRANSGELIVMILTCPGLVVAALLAFERRRALAAAWPVIAPSVFAIGLYLFVFLDKRYVAPWTLGIAVPVAAAACAAPAGWRRCLGAIALATLAVVGAPRTASDAFSTYREFRNGLTPNPEWRIASELRQKGLAANTPIGYVGGSINAYWATLARVRIVAEVPMGYVRSPDGGVHGDAREIAVFWGDAGRRSAAIEAMKSAGARAIIADAVPASANTDGWCRLSSPYRTEYGESMYLLWLDGGMAGRSKSAAECVARTCSDERGAVLSSNGWD